MGTEVGRAPDGNTTTRVCRGRGLAGRDGRRCLRARGLVDRDGLAAGRRARAAGSRDRHARRRACSRARRDARRGCISDEAAGSTGVGRRGEHRSRGGREVDAQVRHPRRRRPRGDAAHRQGPVLHGHDAGTRLPARPGDAHDEGGLPAAHRRARRRAGEHLLRRPVVPRRRHGAGDGRHDRPPRGPEHHLHLRPRQRDLETAGQHAPRPLVPDPGAAGGRAHGRDRRPRRDRASRTSTSRSRATRACGTTGTGSSCCSPGGSRGSRRPAAFTRTCSRCRAGGCWSPARSRPTAGPSR